MGLNELLGLDDLLAQLILAVGAAMALGSGAAIWKHRRGETPRNARGDFRAGRAWWLFVVGLVIAFWGLASLAAA